MAYIPTEWKTGDVITAEKLNKIENAVGNLILQTYSKDGDIYLSGSYKDIVDAISVGKLPILLQSDQRGQYGGSYSFWPLLGYTKGLSNDFEYVVTFSGRGDAFGANLETDDLMAFSSK